MSRIGLAFRCLFKLLFRGRLPPDAVDYLPPPVAPPSRALPEPKAEPKVEATPPAEPALESRAEPQPKPDRKGGAGLAGGDLVTHHRDGALGFLALLQREGRLVDFLRESLDSYTDGDIGAAVRDIHRGCKKVLEEYFAIEAVMPGEEDTRVKVPAGFDPGEVRLIGKIAGEPPFTGTLRHHGWRVTEVKLPILSAGVDRRVVAPAEVEIA